MNEELFEFKIYYTNDKIKNKPVIKIIADIEEIEKINKYPELINEYKGCTYCLNMQNDNFQEHGKIGEDKIGYYFELRVGDTVLIDKDFFADDLFNNWYEKHKNDDCTFIIEKVNYELGLIWVENCPYEIPYDFVKKVIMC